LSLIADAALAAGGEAVHVQGIKVEPIREEDVETVAQDLRDAWNAEVKVRADEPLFYRVDEL
jgi:hypothetical protein